MSCTCGTVLVAASHKLNQVEAKAPTCGEDGWDAYEYCTACDYTTKVVTPATGEHSYDDGVQTKAPNCTEEGEITYTCECGYSYTETIPATHNSIIHVEAKDATCTEAGNIEHWYCTNCGAFWQDAERTLPTTAEETVISALGHCWERENAGYCATDYYCCKCPATNPNYNTVVYFDNTETKWETVKAVYWFGNEINGWAVSQGEKDGIHTFLIHDDAVSIDFRNGGSGAETIRTRRFEVKEDNIYDAKLFVIYFQENRAWDKIMVTGATDDSYDTILSHSSSKTPKDGKHVLYMDEDASLMMATFYLGDTFVYRCQFDVVEGKTYFYPECNHTPGEPADCENDQVCTVCGDVLVEALGHTPGAAVREKETSTGYDLVTYCSVCSTELSRKTFKIVTWFDWNGTMMYEKAYAAEEEIKADDYMGETPLKPEDEKYTYVFAGWKECEGGFMAQYTEIEKEPVVQEDKVVMISKEIRLKDEIEMRYTVAIPENLINAGAYVVMEKTGAYGTVTLTYNASKLASCLNANGNYVVSMGVAPAEITVPITIQVFDGDGNAQDLYKGDNLLGKSASRTVLDYAKAILEANDDRKDLAIALVTYCGYAQKNFNVDADNPAFNILADYGIEQLDLSGITAETLSNYKNTMTNPDMGVKATSINAFIDSNVYIRLFLQVQGDINDYSFTLTTPGGDRTIKPVLDEESNRYYVDIPNIASGYLDYQYKVTVRKGSETNEISTSVLSYARSVLKNSKNSETKKNLVRALYLYNQEANAYWKA